MNNEKIISVKEFENYLHPIYKQNFVFHGHRHQTWEINIVHRGEMEVIYDEHVISLKENMILLFEPNVFHSNRIISKNGVDKTVYQFFTDDITINGKARIYIVDDYLRNIINLIEYECEESKHYFGYFNKTINSKAEMLLGLFLTKLQEEKTQKSFSHEKNAIIFETAVRYMKDHIQTTVSVDEIAKACCVSITKLKRVFSEYTKSGIITYFNNIKLGVAMKYLDEGKSIVETADCLNFSSQSYFSIWFKNLTGVAPIKYKYRAGEFLLKEVEPKKDVIIE